MSVGMGASEEVALGGIGFHPRLCAVKPIAKPSLSLKDGSLTSHKEDRRRHYQQIAR